jgi:DNA-binding transcriptional LysR family regulator
MEELVPVCTPQLAQRIASAADLANHPLLHTDIGEDWATWAGLAGVTGLDLSGGLRFDTIHMALEAAAQGLGIAIGRLPLIATDLAAGRLAPVLSPPRRGSVGYWLVTNREFRVRPEVVAFRDWIRAQFQPP